EMQLELAGEYLVMAAMLAEIKSRMLLPRPAGQEGDEEDPRAELVRRLQEYERFKKAATQLDELPRLERDLHVGDVPRPERKIVQKLPDVTLKELLLAFRDVLVRAEMFSSHHIAREPLSVRQRMAEILGRIRRSRFTSFSELFDVEEGKLGVAVTFIAVLELLKESLIDVVQAQAFAPLHVRASSSVRLVGDDDIGAADEPENPEAPLYEPGEPGKSGQG
ncbi:MAG: ScpA family protein, partial [Pseudomonadota bacterium]